MTKLAFRTLFAAALAAAAMPSGISLAQARDQYGAPIEQPGPPPDSGNGDIRQTVARVSDLTGTVSYARGDDPDNWQPADRNVPMTIGDRLYTDDRSRVEIQVHGGAYVRLGAHTDLAVMNLTDDTKQFAIKSGVASFDVRRLDSDEVFEIDTPNAALTVQRPGQYRVDIDADGNARVTVRDGLADLAAGGGSLSLGIGDSVEIYGGDNPQYETVAAAGRDEWDRWVDQRRERIGHAQSAQYVSQDIVGVDDLDEYGRWDNIPTYGRVWSPISVSVGWTPYRVGHWTWQDPWGWNWVSTEPWGWAPYHYGRWVTYSSRWYWVPVAPHVRYVSYSPALVAFVGGGPGFSATVAVGGGPAYVGWFPLAPADPFIPWWGRPRSNVNVTNITYVNKTYVTVVNQNTFVSSTGVVNNVVQDQTVIRQVQSAPVLRGPVPIAPTRQSLRVATRGVAAVPRPSATVIARPVVARVAPPPAPPTFDRKLAVIQQNRGAPLAPEQAAQVAVQERNRAQTVTAIKPAALEQGRVTLAPRGRTAAGATAVQGNKPVPTPQPIAPLRGRPMATADRPVAAAPVVAPRAANRQPVAAERAPQTTGGAPPTPPSRMGAPTPVGPRTMPEERRVATPPSERGRIPAPVETPRPEIQERRVVTAPAQPPGRPAIEERRVVTPPSDRGRFPAPVETPRPEIQERRVVTPPGQPPGRPAVEERRVATPPSQPRRVEERRVVTPPNEPRRPAVEEDRLRPTPRRYEPQNDRAAPRPTFSERERERAVTPVPPRGRSEAEGRQPPPTRGRGEEGSRQDGRGRPTPRPTPSD